MTALLELQNRLALGRVAYLTTQTWSYKAIGLYKKFGFEPYLGAKPAGWTVYGKKDLCAEIDSAFSEEIGRAWKIIDEKLAEYEATRKRQSETQ